MSTGGDEGSGGAAPSADGAFDSWLREIAETPPVVLTPGAMLGPYRIADLAGSGGMGRVYRARDTRLQRMVAIKVLPAQVQHDPEWLRRFHREARSAGALNHPNVLAIFDVGEHQGVPYVVSELLVGDTLRARLDEGPVPVRRALDWARQIARGLTAAHDAGIVHRDLKPENVFCTQQGLVKILDFGLAKVVTHGVPSTQGVETRSVGTQPGAVLGTAGYMSPEQVRGQELDARSDIFSFGAILFELFTGQRAFAGDTSVVTMHAVLTEDPCARVPDPLRALPPALSSIVRRCLAKERAERAHAIADVGFQLDEVDAQLARGEPGPLDPASTRAGGRRSRVSLALAAVGAGVVMGAGATWLAVNTGTAPSAAAVNEPVAASPPTYRRLTFRDGEIWDARFMPGERSVVYSTRFSTSVERVYSLSLESGDTHVLAEGLGLVGISGAGELLLLGNEVLDEHDGSVFDLSVRPSTGGAPRPVAKRIAEADIGPDERSLVVVRREGAKVRLEMPPGVSRFEADGKFFGPRVSRDGRKIAFWHRAARGWEHPATLLVHELESAVTRPWASGRLRIAGGAFSPNGHEVWFSDGPTEWSRAIYAAAPGAEPRLLARAPGALVLTDVASDGRALVVHHMGRLHARCWREGDTTERDVSWLDRTFVAGLSDSGDRVVLSEARPEIHGPPATYVRALDGTPAMRVGTGIGYALSPDGRWVAAHASEARDRLVLLPTGADPPRALPSAGLVDLGPPRWTSKGRSLVFSGRAPGRPPRAWIQDIEQGPPRALLPEGIVLSSRGGLSPDDRWVVGIDREAVARLYALGGNETRRIPGLTTDDRILQWTSDGRALYVHKGANYPHRVELLDVATGERRPWKAIGPADQGAGLFATVIHPSGKAYCYSYPRIRDRLFLAEGLR